MHFAQGMVGLFRICQTSGLKNDMDNILTCKRGDVSMRHSALRDTEAKIMKEVCSDIKIEPNMLPVGMDNMIGNNADNARLDIP